MSYSQPRYFTGKPCARGHVCDRYTGSRACVECSKLNVASHRAKHPKAAAAATARYRAKDPERANELAKLQRLNNPKSVRAAQKKYAKNNQSKMVAKWSARRARKLNATPPWFGEFDELVMLEAADLAKRSEAITGFAWHVDHMIPLKARTVCGLHVGVNVQVIPGAMNVAKQNKLQLTEPGEWLRNGK